MNLEQLVPRIHATPNQGVVIPTGGGTRVFPMLLEVGGGSNTLLDGGIPYKEFMTDEILGGTPEKYVSELTARQLAMAAYQKALYIRSKDHNRGAVDYPAHPLETGLSQPGQFPPTMKQSSCRSAWLHR